MRGADSQVSEHCLWTNVLVALSQSTQGPSGRSPIQQPTAEATLALQALYNVAIRPNEVTIFSGFLSSVSNAEMMESSMGVDTNQVYGAWTPTKPAAEVDLSQWTTLTPGSEWPSLSTTLASGSGLTPGRPFSPALGLPPIEFSDTVDHPSRPESRTDGDGIKGIDEILAQLEDNEAMRENDNDDVVPELLPPSSDDRGASKSVTDDSQPSSRSGSVATIVDNLMGPSASSPYVSATSAFSATSASTTIRTVSVPQPAPIPETPRQRQPLGMQLTLPAPPFIPPLPMCMFFSPSFRDLQTGRLRSGREMSLSVAVGRNV